MKHWNPKFVTDVSHLILWRPYNFCYNYELEFHFVTDGTVNCILVISWIISVPNEDLCAVVHIDEHLAIAILLYSLHGGPFDPVL